MRHNNNNEGNMQFKEKTMTDKSLEIDLSHSYDFRFNNHLLIKKKSCELSIIMHF